MGRYDPGVWLGPEARVVAITVAGSREETALADPATRVECWRLPRQVVALGPGGEHWVAAGPRDSSGVYHGLSLFRRGRSAPLVAFGDRTWKSTPPVFDRTGTFLAWGNQDGTVSVCNLRRIREHLRALSLDWDE
jgi:hypothetical protein